MEPPGQSELLIKSKERGEEPFGDSWRDRVGMVRGYRVLVNKLEGVGVTVCEIENLYKVAVTNQECLVTKYGNQYFLLLPNEFVTRVEVYAIEAGKVTQGYSTVSQSGQITAIRFRTNQRVSPWHGACVGTFYKFDAPEGQCIQALYGSNGDDGIGQLGVIYMPLALLVPEEQVSAPAYARTALIDSRETEPSDSTLQFDTFSGSLRAVVVTTDNGVADITALSDAQYEALDQLQLPTAVANERWLVLAKDEHIQAVGVVMVPEIVAKLRFRTNYRTTEWFGHIQPYSGRQAQDEIWLDCAGHPCGFHIEGSGKTVCTSVEAISVIYKLPTADHANKLVDDQASTAA